MKFYVDIDVKGLPTTRFTLTAEHDFKKMPPQKGNLLVANESGYSRCICFRDGSCYEGRPDQKGAGDVCTIEFDDFVPGMTIEHEPKWYYLLKDRIIGVQATEGYGPGQGIAVTEHITEGSAVARIRNQQATWGTNDVLVYQVKITASGPQSLSDARKLHAKILSSTI